MRTGRLEDKIFQRTVIKTLNKSSKPSLIRGSALAYSPVSACSTESFFPFLMAYNKALALGGILKYANISITAPEKMEEAQLRELISVLEKQSRYLQIPISAVDINISEFIYDTIISVFVSGEKIEDDFHFNSSYFDGLGIVMTKSVGEGGIKYISAAYKDEITCKYSKRMLSRAVGNTCDLSIAREAKIIFENGIPDFRFAIALGEGGVISGIWELCDMLKCGCDVRGELIFVRQEITEICELYDIDPYGLHTAGGMLVISERANVLANKLNEAGIVANVIGFITDKKDRIIRMGDRVRYIDRPVQDALFRLDRITNLKNFNKFVDIPLFS